MVAYFYTGYGHTVSISHNTFTNYFYKGTNQLKVLHERGMHNEGIAKHR
jgi:hypothetical protein